MGYAKRIPYLFENSFLGETKGPNRLAVEATSPLTPNSKVTTPVGRPRTTGPHTLPNLLVVRFLHPIPLLQNRLLCPVNSGQVAYYES
jgi:hypothetical protein